MHGHFYFSFIFVHNSRYLCTHISFSPKNSEFNSIPCRRKKYKFKMEQNKLSNMVLKFIWSEVDITLPPVQDKDNMYVVVVTGCKKTSNTHTIWNQTEEVALKNGHLESSVCCLYFNE